MRIINIIILSVISAFMFFSCQQQAELRIEIPVVVALQGDEIFGEDSLFHLGVSMVSKYSSDTYLLNYNLIGYHNVDRKLEGVQVEYLDADGSNYSAIIEITPILVVGSSQSGDEIDKNDFNFVNECIFKVDDTSKGHNVKFVSRGKEAILRLPPLDKINK